MVPLDFTHKDKDKKNDKDKPQAAGWAIAPIGAVTPPGQRTDKKQNENDNKNCAEH
jgi:hypothetical protein